MSEDLIAQIPAMIGEPLMVVAAGTDGRDVRIVYANDAAGDLYDCDPDALLGQPLGALAGVDADDAEVWATAAVEGRATDLPFRITRSQGDAWVMVRGRQLKVPPGHYLLHFRDVTNERALASSARQLADRHQAIAKLTSECVYYLRVDPDCRLVIEWAAGAFERLFGGSLDRIRAQGGWPAMVAPEDLRGVQRRARRMLAGDPAEVSYRIRSAHPEPRWLHDRGTPQWDAEGEMVIGMFCVARDVTAERAREALLAAQQQDRTTVAALAGGLICVIDRRGRLISVTGELQGELGDRLGGGGDQDLAALAPGIDPGWTHQLERAWSSPHPITFEFSTDSEVEPEHYAARIARVGDDRLVMLIRRRAGQPLATADVATAPALRGLLDLQSSVAVVLTANLAVLELNGAAERLIGQPRDHAIGRDFVGLMGLGSEQPAVEQDLKVALQGNQVVASEVWLRLPSGQEGRIVWNYSPLRGDAGQVIGVIAQGEALAPLVDNRSISPADQWRLKAIMENIADGIVALDNRSRIVTFSRSAETIFNYARDEVVGKTIDLLLMPGTNGSDDLFDQILAAAKLPGETREWMARRKTGELFPIDLAASEVRFNGDSLHILTIRDISLRKQTEETIRNLAYHDPLTGLPNRLLFNDRLTQAIERARRQQQMLAVVILDLDRFKLINDSLGLASGDQVLRAVSQRLGAAVRRSDTVARLSGDDFLLLLLGVDGAENTAKVAQKLLDAVIPPFEVDDQELHVSATLGITLFPHDGDDAETLIRNADTALYRAKEHNRGGYQFYTNDMNATAFERLVLETQLRRALERGELVLHYQPQVQLETGAVVGVEALVRWFHRDLGLVSPAEFIPLAEETGLIVELGRWVLETACVQVRTWQQNGFGDLRLAVNLSGRQFQESDLVRSIASVVEATALDPEDLELELTESSIMRDPDQAVAKLQALDRLGIRLSIDDFGTGYSSLAHLKRFPIKTLKIDQSFIQDITTDANDAAIAQAIIALAESLRLKVIAEGVETAEQLTLLRRYHCDEIQGYLFSRPLPPDQMFELLQSGTRLRH